MMRLRNALCLGVATSLLGLSAQAATLKVGDNATISVGAMIQPRYESNRNTVNAGQDWSSDFYLKRARALVSGSFNDRVSFGLVTDVPNLGRPGNGNTFIIQDAYVSFKAATYLTLDAGLILIPLSRHGLQGSTSLVSMDVFGAVLAYPGTRRATTTDLRDLGFQARGLVADRVHYRVAVLEGVSSGIVPGTPTGQTTPTVNPHDMPRFAGQVRYSLLGKDDGYALAGLRFARDPLVSVGVGADYQSRAVLNTANVPTDYLANSADVYANYPLADGQQELVFNGNVTRFQKGKDAAGTGVATMAEAAYRYQQYAVFAGGTYYFASAQNRDTRVFGGGLGWYPEKLNFNVKANLLSTTTATNSRPAVSGVVQTQLMF